MNATLTGIVMEVSERIEKDGNRIKICRLYQKGEKNLIDIKNAPDGLGEGEMVSLQCKLFPWATERGLANIACSCINE